MSDKTEAQPEALRLAEFFESLTKSSHRWWDGVPVHEKAATVLRDQATEIQQLKAQLSARQAAPDGWRLVPVKVAEEMHVAAVKVLHRANGVDGLPQRMLDAMLSAAPPPPEREPLKTDLDEFWRSVEDGSVFNVSPELTKQLDRILEANPNIADGICKPIGGATNAR